MIVANASSGYAEFFIGGQTNPTGLKGGYYVEESVPDDMQYRVSLAPDRTEYAEVKRGDWLVVWDGSQFLRARPLG
ncbi:MAG: hypothetical protein GY719_10530 [bacterium]|nr:hypothetical protein [bacterium]